MDIGLLDLHTNKTLTLTADAIARHIHVLGVSGAGKSNLLEGMGVSAPQLGYGLCFLDPHGESVQTVADNLPVQFTERLIYWEPFNLTQKIGYNPLALKDSSPKEKSLATKRITAAILHVFDASDPNTSNFYRELERKIIRHTIRLLMDNNRTLLDMQQCLLDHEWRKELLKRSTSTHTNRFWNLEYDVWNDKQRVEYTASLLNKADDFLSDPIMEHVLSRNTLSLREIMDNGAILLVNLSRGEMGEEASSLLGSLLTAGFVGAALSRADIEASKRKKFILEVDEFAPFANRAFETALSQLRKYKLSLIVAHQYLGQLPEYLADAILGNCSTTIVFRCGEDAERMAKHLTVDQPKMLRDLPNYEARVRTLTGKMPTDAMEMHTFPPAPSGGRLKAVRKRMAACYGA
jgi:type IV secretory pathway TraG/TraD family ATPase VirD4